MNRIEFYASLNNYGNSLKHSQNPMYGQQYDQVKYYKREGEPGNYRYYWTKEEWDAHVAEERAKTQQPQQPKFNSREQAERQAINKNVNSQTQKQQQEYNKQSQSLSPDAQRYQRQNQTQQKQQPKFNSREQAERQAINKNVNSQINEKRLNGREQAERQGIQSQQKEQKNENLTQELKKREAEKDSNTDWDAKIKEEREKSNKEIANHNEKSRIQNEGNKQYIDYMKNNSFSNKKSYGNNFDQDFQTALKEMGVKDLYYRDGEIFYNDSNSDNKIQQAESKLKTYEAQYKAAEQKIASAKTSKEKYEAEKYTNEIAAQCRQAGDEITQAYHEKQKAAYTKFDEVTKYMEENIKNRKKEEDKNLIEEGIDWIKKKFR